MSENWGANWDTRRKEELIRRSARQEKIGAVAVLAFGAAVVWSAQEPGGTWLLEAALGIFGVAFLLFLLLLPLSGGRL